MKKMSFIQKLTISCLVLLLFATTALSYVFWQSGVSGDSEEAGNGVGIGTGSEILTNLEVTIDLLNTDDANNKLIPFDRTSTNPKYTDKMEYVANVRWVGTYNLTNNLDLAIGALVEVELESATVNGMSFFNRTAVEHNPANAEWFKGRPELFLIELNYDDTLQAGDLVHDTQTDTEYFEFQIYFTVRMNQPIDRDEYLLVANHYYSFNFHFAVNTDNLAVNN